MLELEGVMVFTVEVVVAVESSELTLLLCSSGLSSLGLRAVASILRPQTEQMQSTHLFISSSLKATR